MMWCGLGRSFRQSFLMKWMAGSLQATLTSRPVRTAGMLSNFSYGRNCSSNRTYYHCVKVRVGMCVMLD